MVTQVQNGCIPVVARIAVIAAEQTCRHTHELQADFCQIERAAGERRLCTSWRLDLTLGISRRQGSSGVAVKRVTETHPAGGGRLKSGDNPAPSAWGRIGDEVGQATHAGEFR